MSSKYYVNLPAYQYNTGAADNGNKIWKKYFDSKEEALEAKDFLNKCYEKIQNKIELTRKEDEKYEEFFNLPGFQIADAYCSFVTESKF
jgi:hypothetical protein